MIPGKKIGIHAPYSRDEATQLACSLGTVIQQLGLDVSYLSSQAHELGVHPHWDSVVWSGRRRPFEQWAVECSHVIWFDVQKRKLLQSRKLGCRNILVPLYHRLDREDLEELQFYSVVLCPSKASRQSLKDYPGTVLQVPSWDCGLPIKRKPIVAAPSRLLVSVDARTSHSIGSYLCHLLKMVLEELPYITVTLLRLCSWSRPMLAALQDLMRAYSTRIQIENRPDHYQRIKAYDSHDWLLCPSVEENSGLLALEALHSGLPVIAFDIPPISEFVRTNRNGYLIPCDLSLNWLEAPRVELRSRETLDTLLAALTQKQQWTTMVKKNWTELQRRRAEFHKTWQQLLGCA